MATLIPLLFSRTRIYLSIYFRYTDIILHRGYGDRCTCVLRLQNTQTMPLVPWTTTRRTTKTKCTGSVCVVCIQWHVCWNPPCDNRIRLFEIFHVPIQTARPFYPLMAPPVLEHNFDGPYHFERKGRWKGLMEREREIKGESSDWTFAINHLCILHMEFIFLLWGTVGLGK